MMAAAHVSGSTASVVVVVVVAHDDHSSHGNTTALELAPVPVEPLGARLATGGSLVAGGTVTHPRDPVALAVLSTLAGG